MRTRWIVAGRCVVLLIINGRASATFTGRRAAFAPSAASTTSARSHSLPPKPPPMYGDTMRTFSFGMPSVLARSVTPQSIIWFDVHTVSLSPSQAAIDACGSIIACDWSGVVYVASSWTGASLKPLAKSPVAVSLSVSPVVGMVAEAFACARSQAPLLRL